MFNYDDLLDSALVTREYFQQEDICRFCWSKDAGKELYSRMINCTLKSPLFFKVQNCLGIDLSQDDSEYHPKKICADCFLKIEQFDKFKNFCQNSNEKLNTILNVIINKTSIEICPEKIKLEKLEDSAIVLSEESLDTFMDGLQHSEFDMKDVIESPKSSQIQTQRKRCTKTKTLNSIQHPKPSPKKSIKRLASKDTTKKICDETKSIHNGKSNCNNAIEPSIKQARAPYKYKRGSTYCNICCDVFVDKETFAKHNSEAHGIEKDGTFKCFGCGVSYKNRKLRLAHEAYHCKSLENGYECSICNRYLPRRGVYEKHMKDHRYNKVVDMPGDTRHIFKCNKCNDQFTKKSDWKAHMVEHAPKKKYICETCGKVFTRLDYLNKHNTTHTGYMRYVCPHCGFRASQQQNLTIHIRKHTNERPYQCDLCPQRCISNSNLLAHRRRHLGLNSYQCSICNKKFGYKDSLKTHIAVTHERSISYTCPHCGAVYARRGGLRRHLRAKHVAELNKNDKTNTVSNSNTPQKGQNLNENTQGVLYSNVDGDNNEQRVSYPNVNTENNYEEDLHSNQKRNVPISDFVNENNSITEERGEFDLKIGENDKFVCFEKNFVTKDGENIVIVLQE